MNAKVTKVALECPALDTTVEYEISHAERLLRMRNNGGWQLPEKSPFEFVDNGIKRRGNKKSDNGKQEKSDDK
jgi:hypothetical protein